MLKTWMSCKNTFSTVNRAKVKGFKCYYIIIIIIIIIIITATTRVVVVVVVVAVVMNPETMLVLTDRGDFYSLPNIKPWRVIFIINAFSAYQLPQHWRFVTSRTTDNVGRCYPGNVCEWANRYHCDVNITDGRDTHFLLITNNLSAEVIKVSYKLLFHYRCSLYCLMFIVAGSVEPNSSFAEILVFILLCLVSFRPKLPIQKNLLLNCSKHLTYALTDWPTNWQHMQVTTQCRVSLAQSTANAWSRTSYFYGKRRFIIVLLRAWHWSLFEPA